MCFLCLASTYANPVAIIAHPSCCMKANTHAYAVHMKIPQYTKTGQVHHRQKPFVFTPPFTYCKQLMRYSYASQACTEAYLKPSNEICNVLISFLSFNGGIERREGLGLYYHTLWRDGWREAQGYERRTERVCTV